MRRVERRAEARGRALHVQASGAAQNGAVEERVMLFSPRAALERCATLRVIAAALAVAAACVAGLAWLHGRLGGLATLDARGWYAPGEAAALFDALDRLDDGARTAYATTALTVDMAFPAAYGLLFAILLLRLFRTPFYLLPVALAATDVLENLTVASLALGYDGSPSPLAWAAAAFTLAKTALVYATLGAMCIGLAGLLWSRLRRRL